MGYAAGKCHRKSFFLIYFFSTAYSGGSRIFYRGRGPVGRGVDLWHGCFLAKMYAKMCAKMKELSSVGGHVPGTPPRSSNGLSFASVSWLLRNKHSAKGEFSITSITSFTLWYNTSSSVSQFIIPWNFKAK